MAKFNNADLSGVDFTGANLRNANLSGVKNLDKVKSWQGCIINDTAKLPESFKFPDGMIVENRRVMGNMGNNYKNRLPENHEFDMNGMVFDKSIKRNASLEEPQKPESKALKTPQIIIETKEEFKTKQTPQSSKFEFESCTWIEIALKLILNKCFCVYESFTAKYEESKKSQKNDNKQI